MFHLRSGSMPHSDLRRQHLAARSTASRADKSCQQTAWAPYMSVSASSSHCAPLQFSPLCLDTHRSNLMWVKCSACRSKLVVERAALLLRRLAGCTSMHHAFAQKPWHSTASSPHHSRQDSNGRHKRIMNMLSWTVMHVRAVEHLPRHRLHGIR
jgi:hypothetical protein